MLMTVEDLRKYIATEETDEMLAAKLKALELTIRKYTNNNFMVRGIRTAADAFNKTFTCKTVDNFKVGDTVQVSMSDFMDGQLCTVAAIEGDTITVNEDIYHEDRDGDKFSQSPQTVAQHFRDRTEMPYG